MALCLKMFSLFAMLITSDIEFSLAGYSILAKTVAIFMTAALTAQNVSVDVLMDEILPDYTGFHK